MDKKKIIDLLKEKLADILEISVDEIDVNENFMKLGVSSIEAMDIISEVSEELDVELSPVAIFEHKTIDMFADYIANGGECAESEE